MISPFSYSLGSGCCYGVRSVSRSISAGELESGSGISDQKSEGGVLGERLEGGVTLARHAQVVRLKRDSICGVDASNMSVCVCEGLLWRIHFG